LVNAKAINLLLQFSVVGLGFGMNVNSALSAGKMGFFFTVASILSTLLELGKWLKIDSKSHLILVVQRFVEVVPLLRLHQSFNQMKTDFNFFGVIFF
jgi:hypothetical protein